MALWGEQIFGSVNLGDKRLDDRLIDLVERFVERPEAPIPMACGTWAATVAAYRFFGHSSISPEAITECLASGTVNRCAGQPVILAVQDTTSLDFSTHSKTTGLGSLEQPDLRGLFLHTTLAVTPDGVPLGVLDQQMWARDPEHPGTRHRRKHVPVEGKESRKWLDGLRRTEARLNSLGRVVTIADREADVYELFALAQELHGDWLIRARHDRAVERSNDRLRSVVEHAPVDLTLTIEVPRSTRGPRTATVEVRRARALLVPPPRAKVAHDHWWAHHPKAERLVPRDLPPLSVGVVLVSEPDPPPGEAPLRWLLITNLLVETPEAAVQCVEWYCQRWKIEQFHYVLKSGCHVERLQLDRVDRLKRALALYSAVAWALLYLTYRARMDPTAPCTTVLDDESWQALWTFCYPAAPLPTEPLSLHQAIILIARLGGFLARKHDGHPGVKTTWRGLTRLSDILATWRILTRSPDPPPSSHLTLATAHV